MTETMTAGQAWDYLEASPGNELLDRTGLYWTVRHCGGFFCRMEGSHNWNPYHSDVFRDAAPFTLPPQEQELTVELVIAASAGGTVKRAAWSTYCLKAAMYVTSEYEMQQIGHMGKGNEHLDDWHALTQEDKDATDWMISND